MHLPGRVLIGCALLALTGAALADPRDDFLMHCAGCHRVDASGVVPAVPSLAGPLGRLVATAEGRDYVARVPGASQTPLSDAELAAVFNWLLTEYNRDTLPQGFKPLEAAEIGRSRARVLTDPLKRRRELWPDLYETH